MRADHRHNTFLRHRDIRWGARDFETGEVRRDVYHHSQPLGFWVQYDGPERGELREPHRRGVQNDRFVARGSVRPVPDGLVRSAKKTRYNCPHSPREAEDGPDIYLQIHSRESGGVSWGMMCLARVVLKGLMLMSPESTIQEYSG